MYPTDKGASSFSIATKKDKRPTKRTFWVWLNQVWDWWQHFKRRDWRKERVKKDHGRLSYTLKKAIDESPDEVVHHLQTCGQVLRVPEGAKWLKLDLRWSDEFNHYLVIDWASFKKWLFENFLEYRLYTAEKEGGDSWDSNGRWISTCPSCGKRLAQIDAVDRFDVGRDKDNFIDNVIFDVWKCLSCKRCFVLKIDKKGVTKPVTGAKWLKLCQEWIYDWSIRFLNDPQWSYPENPMKMDEFLKRYRTDF